jgi:hypothetical protein
MQDERIILPGRVKDNTDPLMLGRVRIEPQTKLENQSIPTKPDGSPKSVDDYAWTSEDPFIFLPLLPYYINQIPEVGEYVNIIYSTRKEPLSNNKFYVQGPLSRPWNNERETYENAQSTLDNGTSIQKSYQPRNSKTGVVQEIVKDIYPLPGDNALLSRGSTDLVLKKTDVLLRAGKFLKTQVDQSSGVGETTKPDVTPYDKRSFLQLSIFNQELVDVGIETIDITKFVDKDVKNFVEWDISNINLTANTVDGYVQINSVTNVTTSNFGFNTGTTVNCNLIPNSKYVFTGLSVENSIVFINNYIRGFNKGNINIDGYNKYPNSGNLIGQFPFVFGPSISTNTKILDTSPSPTIDFVENSVVINIYNKIKLFDSSSEYGFAVIWDYNTVGPQVVKRLTDVEKSEYSDNPVTYATMGGDFIYLLTHKTTDDKFTIDLKNTLYGIDQPKFTDYLKDKTNSMVRGEELYDILDLIIRWISGHVHNPVKPPSKISGTGENSVSLDNIQTLLNSKKFLNPNIRIN